MAPPQQGMEFYAYGYMGWEMEIDSHIKTRVMFLLSDLRQTQLAWYVFSYLEKKEWQHGFDLVVLGERKLDRNEMFGSALSMALASKQWNSRKFDFRKLAPRLPAVGADAVLTILDNPKLGTTTCLVWIDTAGGVLFDFDLKTEFPRKEKDVRDSHGALKGKLGRAFMVGVEKFTPHALDTGPGKSIAFKIDPRDPIF